MALEGLGAEEAGGPEGVEVVVVAPPSSLIVVVAEMVSSSIISVAVVAEG